MYAFFKFLIYNDFFKISSGYTIRERGTQLDKITRGSFEVQEKFKFYGN